MSGRLRRDEAPISAEAWSLIEEEATRALRHYLAARPLVDFEGPLGWEHSSVSLGRTDAVATPPGTGVEGRLRRVPPGGGLRTPLSLHLAAGAAVRTGGGRTHPSPPPPPARRAAGRGG